MAVAALGLEVDCDDVDSDSDSDSAFGSDKDDLWRAALWLLEIWDSYTLSDWSPFWNQLKNEQLQTDNYNCQNIH